MRRGTSGSSGRKRQGDDGAGKLLAKQLAAEVKEAFGSGATESDAPAKETGVETPVKLEGEAARPSVGLSDPGIEPKARAHPDREPAPPIPSTEIEEPPKGATAAEPLPARMLNEFVYCPRLFYYEHVEGVFVDNADTVRGAAVHARVDKGTGALPAAQSAKTNAESDESDSDREGEDSKPRIENEKIHSRSVTLGSERLGVIAKLDLVEMRAAGEEDCPELLSRLDVCPVDYKAGAPREGEDGNELWPTDRMQLGLQILILRENGYRCDRGIIYYRAAKQRVPLEWTPELEAWVSAQVDSARQTMSGPIPPPLVGSPKCVRCSLNSVCLPDETRMLAARADESLELDVSPRVVAGPRCRGTRLTAATTTSLLARKVEGRGTLGGEVTAASQLSTITNQLSTSAAPRRLMSPRDDTRVLYLNTPGVRVGRKDEVLTVKDEDKTLSEVRIGDLTHVALFGNIQISTQAIQALCEREIPVTYFSMGGWFYGITRGHELKNVFTRMEQFRLARDPAVCLALARRMIFGKPACTILDW